MQSACIRIVDHIGAMPNNEHDPCKAVGQGHRAQHGLGRGYAGFEVGLRIEAWRRVVRNRHGVETESVANEFRRIDWSCRFDKREGGDGRELEATPGTLCTRPVTYHEISGLVGLAARGRCDARVEQNWQPQFLNVGGKAPMLGKDAEEAGESDCLNEWM